MKHFDFDIICSNVWNKVLKYRYEILSSLFFGILAYGFYFTNMVYNYDSMQRIYRGVWVWEYRLGRWGIDLIRSLSPHPTMPWYDGMVSLMLYALGTCLISNIFHFRNKYTRILLAAVIISYPAICVEYLFIFQAIYYSLAFVLAAASVWLWVNSKSAWWYVASVLCIVMSLGLYQALLAIASSLMVVCLMKDLLSGSLSAGKIVRKGLVGLGILSAGVVLYFLITKMFFLLKGSGFADYAKAAMDDEIPFCDRLLNPYVRMVNDLLFTDRWRPYVIVSRWSSVFHVVALLCCGFALTMRMRGRLVADRLMLLLLLVMYPLSVNFMWSVSALERATKPLVQVGFVSIYVFMAVVLENIDKREWVSGVVKTALCCIVLINVRFSNVTAMRTKLLFDHTFSFYTTLVTQIKSSGMLDAQSKLAICGETDQFLFDMRRKYPNYTSYAGKGVNNYSKQSFIKFYLGFDIPQVSLEEKMELVNTEEFQAMPIYPYEGSIRKFGDVIVVKFSHKVKDIK